MTPLLEHAVDQLRQLPETLQDSVARAVLLQLAEEFESDDRETVPESDFEPRQFIAPEHWRGEATTANQ